MGVICTKPNLIKVFNPILEIGALRTRWIDNEINIEKIKSDFEIKMLLLGPGKYIKGQTWHVNSTVILHIHFLPALTTQAYKGQFFYFS